MDRFLATFAVVVVLSIPVAASAQQLMGGRIATLLPCFLDSSGWKEVILTPPRAGTFIWNFGTRTYPFGPPAHVGQYLLGTAMPPTFCVISPFPLMVSAGVGMIMEGSSQ